MIWIILAVLAAVFITWRYAPEALYHKPWLSKLGYFSMYLAGCLITAFFINAFISFGSPEMQIDGYDQKPLANLVDNNGVSGRFFLGSGTIDSTQYYAFYTGDNETGYSLEKEPASLSKVFMIEEGQEPFWRTNYISPKNKWLVLFGKYDKSYSFHVPKGSIVNNYTLDAQ